MKSENEFIVYVNYFGLKSSYIQHLQVKYQKNLIVDDTQAFFQKGYKDIWSFNSARKFIGVPDGAYLYGAGKIEISDLKRSNPSWDYLIHRSKGNLEIGYQLFKEYEASLTPDLFLISERSEECLNHIDYEHIVRRRRENFQFLERKLQESNVLQFSLDENDVPLYYPFLISESLHDQLAKLRIFIPHLWPELLNRKSYLFNWENHLAEFLMPLPIDQRYTVQDMKTIVKTLKRFL